MTRVTQMGLTVAIPARDMPDTREAARAYVQNLAEQTTEAVKRAAGGVPPAGPFAVNLHPPSVDPILGRIYALTVAAPFDLDRLPADCEFYLAATSGGEYQPETDAIAGGGA